MPKEIPAQVYNFIRKYGKEEGFAYLQSGERSLIFVEPVIKAYADGGGSYLETTAARINYHDKWQAFEHITKGACAEGAPSAEPRIAGFLAYELVRLIEKIEAPLFQEEMPLYLFYLYRRVIEFSAGNFTEYFPEWRSDSAQLASEAPAPFWEMTESVNDLAFAGPGRPTRSHEMVSVAELEAALAPFSNFTKERYIESVSKIIDLIRCGEVYQVNLTQRFTLPLDETVGFIEDFLDLSCAAFGGYFQGSFDSRSFSVVSASPERFLEYDGRHLLTSPIKGTKLSETGDAESFRQGIKEQAELSMIVDIERNDLGKVAAVGSVQVDRHLRIERLPYVDHLVSDVRCRLKEGTQLSDIIRAAFPSGSITGAPKIAAMNFISEFEETARGIYTGSLGWIGDGAFSLNVAIRTALISQGHILYSAGGGIVLDSDPASEYLESLAKTLGFYSAYKRAAI